MFERNRNPEKACDQQRKQTTTSQKSSTKPGFPLPTLFPDASISYFYQTCKKNNPQRRRR